MDEIANPAEGDSAEAAEHRKTVLAAFSACPRRRRICRIRSERRQDRRPKAGERKPAEHVAAWVRKTQRSRADASGRNSKPARGLMSGPRHRPPALSSFPEKPRMSSSPGRRSGQRTIARKSQTTRRLMGLLKIFSQTRARRVRGCPPGSITVDRQGDVVTTTVSSAYPKTTARDCRRSACAVQGSPNRPDAAELEVRFILPACESPPVKCAAAPSSFLTPFPPSPLRRHFDRHVYEQQETGTIDRTDGELPRVLETVQPLTSTWRAAKNLVWRTKTISSKSKA